MGEGTYQPESSPNIPAVQQNIAGSHLGSKVASEDDLRTVEALRSGNEAAFVSLVDHYHAPMLQLAMIFVSSQAVAEEVVQEAWMGVFQGLERFEGRSSLKTWIFRILTNCAKTRAQREGRSMPFSSLPDFNIEATEPAVDPEQFMGPGQQSPGHWVSFPRSWDDIPEERILSQETGTCIQSAIDALPPNQREVITLRDIEGWSSGETCNLLGISEANQRVLLHRARSRVRCALEKYFEE